MKLSIFTTVTNPINRGDAYHEAINCYKDLADEVVVVNGGGQITNYLGVTYVNRNWPEEFDWPFIGEQFTRGYKACTGDAVIHADLDFIFHEKDFEDIRNAAQLMLDNNLPAMTFYKYQFVLPDRYNLKSRLVIMVNKRDYGDRIKFDSSGDLCQPSIDGRYLSPDSVPQSKIGFYNYEKLLKTKAQVMDDVGRMERAYKKHFHYTQYGSNGTDKDAYKHWIDAQIGKFNKPQQHVRLEDHPKYVRETINNLKPEQFGFNGHGKLEGNDYVSSS